MGKCCAIFSWALVLITGNQRQSEPKAKGRGILGKLPVVAMIAKAVALSMKS